jgi:hypothetical protein
VAKEEGKPKVIWRKDEMGDFTPTEYIGLEVRYIASCISIYSCEQCHKLLGKYNWLFGYQQKYPFCSKECFLEWMKARSDPIKMNEEYLTKIADDYVESIASSKIDLAGKRILINSIIEKLSKCRDTL